MFRALCSCQVFAPTVVAPEAGWRLQGLEGSDPLVLPSTWLQHLKSHCATQGWRSEGRGFEDPWEGAPGLYRGSCC